MPKVTDPKKGEDTAKDKARTRRSQEPKLPDEFLGQAIKEVVMHEVGHSLGLRHNFKASTMLRPDQINDTSITRVKGMTGSVMDYNPINVAPKGQKQGDYASTTIGPYDYWAIEYAYKPVMGNEEAELKKIAARSPEPDLVFATDDDFMQQRPPGEHLRPDVRHPGLRQDADGHGQRDAQGPGPEGRQGRRVVGRLRGRVPGLHQPVRQRGVSRGRAHRRPVGQPRLQGGRQGPRPDHARRRLPASARHSSSWSTRSSATRRSSSRPAMLRKLITESWQDERVLALSAGSDYPIYQVILNIQEIVLDQCLDSGVLQRIQNQETAERSRQQPDSRSPRSSAPLSDGIFTELAAAASGQPSPFAISTIRRNLQREYIKRLSTMVLGPKNDPSFGNYRFIVILGGSPRGPSRCQEPGAAAPRRDRPEDRQAPGPGRTSRSTTPRWPT